MRTMRMRWAPWRISPPGSTCADGASWWWRGPATAATRTFAPSRIKVAGRFDHYICRRDDSLRGRADARSADDDRADAARARTFRTSAIEVIPDEQAAIDAALRTGPVRRFAAGVRRCAHPFLEADHQIQAGQRGRLDARPAAAAVQSPPRTTSRPPPPDGEDSTPDRDPDDAALEAQGFVREERGLRFVGEAAD